MILQANYHTHTNLCDGSNTPQEMAEQAIRIGFKHLGFSGHVDPDVPMDLPLYLRTIRKLQEQYRDQIEILCGMELDILYAETLYGKNWDGKSPAVLYDEKDPSFAKVDYRIGSTHYLKLPGGRLMAVDMDEETIRNTCRDYFGGDYYRMAADYYELESHVIEQTHCTFIGHFDLITRFNDSMHFLDETDPRYLNPALTAMETLARQGVPFEINCGAYNRNRKKEFYPHSILLKALKEFGGEIMINSDAHQKELLNGAFPEAIEAAKAAGFDHLNLLTKEGTGKIHFIQQKII